MAGHRLGAALPTIDRCTWGRRRRASSRDLRTHLGDGRTGSSTVRRSFAALLHDSLDLTAQPRNPHKPERPANYGLAPPGDQRLTKWMRDRLTLAVWPKALGIDLADVERALLESWLPALNLQGVNTLWSAQLSAARKAMAGEARRWARERGFAI